MQREYVTYPTGYDTRCAKCWLGHAHTTGEHWMSIAHRAVWGDTRGEWTSPRSATTIDQMIAWLSEHAPAGITRADVTAYVYR